MFDIRPTDKTGRFDVSKLSGIKSQINLRWQPETKKLGFSKVLDYEGQIIPVVTGQRVVEDNPVADSRKKIINELEALIAGPVDLTAELASIGGELSQPSEIKIRPRVNKKKPRIPAEPNWISVSSLAAKEIELLIKSRSQFQTQTAGINLESVEEWHKNLPFRVRPPAVSRKGFLTVTIWFIGIGGLLLFAADGGIAARDNVLKNGDNATANLEQAKSDLKNFDFSKAANSFALAYDDFDRASSTLSELGASIMSVFGNLPGFSKINSANNIVKAGQSVSKAGEDLSLAFSSLYKSNLLASLTQTGQPSFYRLALDFRNALKSGAKNIKNAKKLLASVSSEAIPESKKALLADFNEKIPEFESYLGQAIGFSDFALKLTSGKGVKNYLILLQNNSELRANGGFPGSYALATFENGHLSKIFVDDVYNPDGQLRENIIPPQPLQHITPTWGMRDAGWFADFPASARKIEEFALKNGIGGVDGVITLTPNVVTEILKVTGPVEMPEYKLTLDYKNFLTQTQLEVEYGENRVQPKSIVKDFQPRLFAKFAQLEAEGWKQVLEILAGALRQKQIIAYFNDKESQNFLINNNFGGQIRLFEGDYLQVVISNIKGSKTDAVTETAFSLKTSLAENSASHRLTISRIHNGGGTNYGFYNKTNPAYIRVYAPKGARLENITGNSVVDYRPIVDYGGPAFQSDPDLAAINETLNRPSNGADVFEESGKTVFGFWLVVKPKEKKSVTLEYTSPIAASGQYSLLWQKQSGTGGFPLSFSLSLPEGKAALNKSPLLENVTGGLTSSSDLSIDREFRVVFR